MISEWKTIDSAPKDETYATDAKWILLFKKGGDGKPQIVVGKWSDHGKNLPEWGWMYGEDATDYFVSPTHWMELPAPPEAK